MRLAAAINGLRDIDLTLRNRCSHYAGARFLSKSQANRVLQNVRGRTARGVYSSSCWGCRLTFYIQLIPFLRDKNPQVRQIAIQNLLGHTPKEAPCRSIFLDGLRGGGLQGTQDNDVIRDLKLLCRDHLVSVAVCFRKRELSLYFCQATAHDAFRALVNLSDNSMVQSPLSEPTFLTFLVAYILVSITLQPTLW